MITDVKRYIGSFNFCFSHVPEELTLKDIANKLLDIEKQMNSEYRDCESLVTFIQ
jgi:hypothetical protein